MILDVRWGQFCVHNTLKMVYTLAKTAATLLLIQILLCAIFNLFLYIFFLFKVGISFSFELEIKSRTKNAILLSVGKLEFLTLQLLNGTVKFSVNNGAGIETVIYEPPINNLICDGHWHQIKVYI